ncbi:MAG: GAF domain-containing protein [Elusimicrobiota bacterium]
MNSKKKNKKEQISYLSKISEAITSDRYLEEILNLIVSMTAELMGSKICSIMLLDEESKELVITATQSLSDEYRNKPNIKVGESVSGMALINKKPVTVKDVTKDPAYMYPEIAAREGIVSMLAVPMSVQDKVIGVVNSYTDSEQEFNESEINILQAVANQAAVAIENTRLRNEVLKARQEIKNRKKIEKAKGILMNNLDIKEEEAYRRIRNKSMNSRKSMAEIAEAIILTFDLEK